MKVTEFDSFIANTPIPFLCWEWHSRKAWTLLGRCPGKPQKIDLNVMTVPIHLSLQTIDRSEAVRLNLYLRWRNFTEQEVSCPQFAQAPRESFLHLFLFFLILYFTQRKQSFYVLCKWFLRVVWQLFLSSFVFFLRENKSQKGGRGDKHQSWCFLWKYIWIQNLAEGVSRFLSSFL